MDKTGLLAEIRGERMALEEEFSRLNDAQLERVVLYGRWNPKDLLAHLGFWEQRTANLVRELTAGREPVPIGPGQGLDELNEKTYQANHGRSFDEVRTEELAAYQDLVSLVEKTIENDLIDPARFPWLKGTSLEEIVADNTYRHYAEHLPHLVSALGHDHTN